jgi:hypothetical protein
VSDAVPAPPGSQVSSALVPEDVPWVPVPVYQPPTVPRRGPRVNPLVVGALVGILVVVVLALLLL